VKPLLLGIAAAALPAAATFAAFFSG